MAVGAGRHDRDKVAVLESCLDRAGLAASGLEGHERRPSASRSCSGYDRRDRSNINDPELVDAVARYLLRHGVHDVAVLEAPTVYGNHIAIAR